MNASMAAMGLLSDERPGIDLDSLDMSTGMLVANLALVFVCGTLAGASGVGGGAIYTPLYIVLFGLVYEAIPLSKAAVCGAALAFFVFNVAQPVPLTTKHANRFAYDAIMVMEPATLLGTVVGVLFSRMCPYWLITALMASLLALSATKTFAKARKLRAKEDVAGAVGAHETCDVPGALLGPGDRDRDVDRDCDREPQAHRTYNGYSPSAGLGGSGPGNGLDLGNGESSGFEYVGLDRLDAETGFSKSWLGWRCAASVGVCFATVLLGAMAADPEFMPELSQVTCGGVGFWALLAVNALVCAAVTASNVRFLVSNGPRLRRQCAVQWDRPTGTRYALLCLLAGFASALCGIGGSTIKGPILLEMGLHPTLSKATSQLMLLSTVSSSAFQFFLTGTMPPYFGGLFFVMGAFSGFTGKFLIDRYVAWNGRQSTIIYLLAYYIVLAALLMSSLGVIIILGQVTPEVNWQELGFRGVCDPTPNDLTALKWLATFSFAAK